MLNKKLLSALIIGMLAVPCAVYIDASVRVQDGAQDEMYRHDVWERVLTFVGIERVNASHLAVNYLDEIATRNETTGGVDLSYRITWTEIYDMSAVNITVIHFYSNNIDPQMFGVHYYYHYYDDISGGQMFRNNYLTGNTTYRDQPGHEQGIIDNITIPVLIWTPETEALFQHDRVLAWVVENGTTVQRIVDGQVSRDEFGNMIFA